MTEAATTNGLIPLGPAVIDHSETFDLPCYANGRTYRLWIARPAQAPPPAGWPLFLATDGQANFATLAAHAAVRALGDCAAALVVAIGYPDAGIERTLSLRNTDLTPPTDRDKLPQFIVPEPGLALGGADVFRRFVTDAVLPAIAAIHPVDPARRTLFGHSLGGLFALHSLFQQPDVFSTYVASSPSLWWGDRMMFDALPGFRAQMRGIGAPPRVLITVGARETHAELPEGIPEDVAQQMDAMFARGRMVENAREMAAALATVLPPANVALRVIADEGHIGVVPAALSKALSFAVGPRARFAAPV